MDDLRSLRNGLGAWRFLVREFEQVTAIASRYEKLVSLSAEQIQCYESTLKERLIGNDELINCVKAAEELSGKRMSECSQLKRELQEMLNQLIRLKTELYERNNMLVKAKLDLYALRQKLQQQADRTNRMLVRLVHNKEITVKLLERNNKLNERSIELVELYKTRALMFVYRLLGMAQELIVTKHRSQAFVNASNHLESKNKELERHQRVLINRLARRVHQEKQHSAWLQSSRNVFKMALNCMWFLWECVSSLAYSPNLKSSGCRCYWALV